MTSLKPYLSETEAPLRADVDARPGEVLPFAINMEKAVAFDPVTEARIG